MGKSMAEDEAKQPTVIQLRRIRAATKSATVSPEQITYQHTVLCQTSLPYRDPGAGIRVWEREQGNIALRVEAGAARDPQTRRFIEQGLPYGARPRLILAHLNREALLTGSPTIEVESSLTAFIKRLQGSNPNGKETRRFKEQLTRFSCATVRMAADISPQQSYQVDTKIVSAFELWQCDERQHVLWPAMVTLSLDYFHSLTK